MEEIGHNVFKIWSCALLLIVLLLEALKHELVNSYEVPRGPMTPYTPLNIANTSNIDLLPATPLNIVWFLLISMNSFYPP